MELEYVKKLSELNDECETDLLKEFPKEILDKIKNIKMTSARKNPTEKMVEGMKKLDAEICKLMQTYVDENYDYNGTEEEAQPKTEENETDKTTPKQDEKQNPIPAKAESNNTIEQKIIAKLNSSPDKRISKPELESILGNPIKDNGDLRIGTLKLSKVLWSNPSLYYL